MRIEPFAWFMDFLVRPIVWCLSPKERAHQRYVKEQNARLDRAADAIETWLNEPDDSELLDGAMHSVWLHGDWRWLTKNMTTPQKEAAWAAVKRHSHLNDPDGEPLTDEHWAWWRVD